MTVAPGGGRERGRDEIPGDFAEPPDDPGAARIVGFAFLLTALAGLALAAAILVESPTPLQGVLLFIALGSLGFAIVLWAHRLLSRQEYVERRHPLRSDPANARLVADTLVAERGLSRRRVLRWLLVAGLGGVAAAFAAPLLSLGPPPGPEQSTTGWRRGLRLVDETGRPIQASEVPLNGIRTVFPEGLGPSAQDQTVLLRVEPATLALPGGRAAWAPRGYVAYSKLCTHAGCPVGLYQASTNTLLCPCHQSTFLALEGARPVFGPAARPLPQLPIALQPDGTLAALGDFLEPVGPSYWNVSADPGRVQA